MLYCTGKYRQILQSNVISCRINEPRWRMAREHGSAWWWTFQLSAGACRRNSPGHRVWLPGFKPTSAVSQWWTLSKLYNLSQPQFLLKTTKCNCTWSHPRGLQWTPVITKVNVERAVMCEVAINPSQRGGFRPTVSMSSFLLYFSLFPNSAIPFPDNKIK